MTSEIIKNSYDGPKKPPKEIKSGQFKLDFAYSQDAEEVDTGIKETIRGVKLSIMAMGIALYRVDVSGLFIDLGFNKFGEYIDHLAGETGMARTSLYNWEYIGEAYVTHHSDLDRIGFSDDDGPTKLPFLGRALENHPKREVFNNIKNMSLREFERWAKEPLIKNDKKFKNVIIKGDALFIGTKPLVSFNPDASPADRRYYEGLLLEGAQAIEKNEYARVYRFYDESEARRFDKVYQRELKVLRSKK
jgi:hypothetical protein